MRLQGGEPTWVPMATTWEQRLARQLLWFNTDTLQFEFHAFLDDETPWIRADHGLLHLPNLAHVVDDPIIPVGISEVAWELCNCLDSVPRINSCIEAITSNVDEFHDSLDPGSGLLDDTYAVDLLAGGVARNRQDPDHVRELNFWHLMQEYRENDVQLVDEPYQKLPHPWNKWVPGPQHASMLTLLNS